MKYYEVQLNEEIDQWGTKPLLYTDSTTRAYVLAELLEGASSAEHAWRLFHFGWEMCDAVPMTLAAEILAMLPRDPNGTKFLETAARAFYDTLEDEFLVYRGSAPANARSHSWTTDLEVALSFAEGHRGITVPAGSIFGARVLKSQVLTVMIDRQESTVIVDPAELPIYRAFTITKAREALSIPSAEHL